MNLHQIRKIDQDWADQIHLADRLQLVADDLLPMLSVVQAQIREFTSLVTEVQNEMTKIRKFKYQIQYPDGSVDNCLCDAPSPEIALKIAEKYALDLHEFAIVTTLIEVK